MQGINFFKTPRELNDEIDEEDRERVRVKRVGLYKLRQLMHKALRSFLNAEHVTQVFEAQDIWRVGWIGDNEHQMVKFQRIFKQVRESIRKGSMGTAEEKYTSESYFKQIEKTRDQILLQDIPCMAKATQLSSGSQGKGRRRQSLLHLQMAMGKSTGQDQALQERSKQQKERKVSW